MFMFDEKSTAVLASEHCPRPTASASGSLGREGAKQVSICN